MDTEQRIDKLGASSDETRERLVRMEVQLKEMDARVANKEDIAHLRTDIYKLEVRMVKWFIFTAFGMTTAMGGIAVATIRLIH
ncbi:hypothetical protein GTP55_08140 [Duganella sp. FT109W]|nr:hypothetical protein [Duganella margarita]MYN39339.1 hypothetical protein [Duganella margarita]